VVDLRLKYQNELSKYCGMCACSTTYMVIVYDISDSISIVAASTNLCKDKDNCSIIHSTENYISANWTHVYAHT